MADDTVATEKCCRGAQEKCEAKRKGSGRCCGVGGYFVALLLLVVVWWRRRPDAVRALPILLSNVIICYQMLSFAIKCYHLLSNVIICYFLLSNVIICYFLQFY
jgi:hypothetical protein